MQEWSSDELLNLEEIYIDFAAMINLLEAWNNKENKVEILFILEKLKSSALIVIRLWRLIWPCAGGHHAGGSVSFKYYIGRSDNRIRSKSTEQRVIVPQG